MNKTPIQKSHYCDLYIVFSTHNKISFIIPIYLIFLSALFNLYSVLWFQNKHHNPGYTFVQVTEEANDQFQGWLRQSMKNLVYGGSPGQRTSWYQNKQGYNYILWPTNCFKYWWNTHFINFHHFKLNWCQTETV